jgi:hypothetical protein
MKKSVFVLAAAAMMVSGAVMAKDVSKKAMTNAEMDKVVAAGVDNDVYVPWQACTYGRACGATDTGNYHTYKAANIYQQY